MKNKTGITLVALVITIIVLLILAGVSIAMLTGENGILDNSEKAIGKSENAQIQENLALADYENKIETELIEGAREISSPKMFNGTIVTNTLGSSNTHTTVNNFTVKEEGFYTINYLGRLEQWTASSVLGIYMYKNNECIGGNMYSNGAVYNEPWINSTAIEELKVGDTIKINVYEYNNTGKNLIQNKLQLIKH